MAQITELQAKNVKPGDKPIGHGAVPGLWLVPGQVKGHGKWILRYVSPVTKKRRDMGLGTYPETIITAARDKGIVARKHILEGNDPITERDAAEAAHSAQAATMTFEQAARKVHDDWKAGWRNAKHKAQWLNTLRDYVFPAIGSRKVDDLTAADFATVLKPIWLTKVETASRIKQRCHKVMKWCQAQGLVAGNPVDVVNHLLPQQPGKSVRVQHQPAMPWRDVPTFISNVLRSSDHHNVTRALLEFVILTAARSGEARAMLWDEVDLTAKIWTVPANRMKAKAQHRVPLAARAIEILERQRQLHPNSKLVFLSPRGKVLSDMALTKFLRDHKVSSSDEGRTATTHGFRSSFRDWASESGYPRDLAERALGHTIKNQTEAAYHRTDLLDQRRPMMEAWARHICGLEGQQNVVPIAARR